MSAIGNLLSRLHGVFNKDPQREPVLTLGNDVSAQVSISDLRLIGTQGLNVDLSGLTLQTLVDAINAVPGYSASLVSTAYAGLLARAILDDGSHGVKDDPSLYYPTSLLWAEMQTYGWMLDEQATRLRELTKQLYLHTADTDWLEYWSKDYFGKPKEAGETDLEYQRRTIHEMVSLNQNNKALENLVEGALEGSNCEVIDSAADPAALIEGTRPFTWFKVLVGFDLNEGEVSFSGKYEKALALIKKAKAAGTKIEYLELAGHLAAQNAAPMNMGAAMAMTEVIEVFPISSLAFEDLDDIITEDGDDLMK